MKIVKIRHWENDIGREVKGLLLNCLNSGIEEPQGTKKTLNLKCTE